MGEDALSKERDKGFPAINGSISSDEAVGNENSLSNMAMMILCMNYLMELNTEIDEHFSGNGEISMVTPT